MPGGHNHYRDKGFSRGYVTGGSDAAKKIWELGEDVLKAAKAALADGAELIVEDAKSRCPVSNSKYLSHRGLSAGELRDSIKAEPKKSGTIYKISANAQDNKGFYYGQVVEFSPRVNHPFLYPAMDANRAAVHDKIVAAIQQACQTKQGK